MLHQVGIRKAGSVLSRRSNAIVPDSVAYWVGDNGSRNPFTALLHVGGGHAVMAPVVANATDPNALDHAPVI